MPLTGLTGEAVTRFGDLLKAGVSYRTALALADRVTDADLAAVSTDSFPLDPVQRGLWAPNTVYALRDLAISPTGDLITPKVAFTSGAAYSAANWNILVPASNYGRELCAAENGADVNLLSVAGTWTDIAGMTGIIPAGIPFVAELHGICASLQGTAAAGSVNGVQLRLVDSTATTVYCFAWRQFYFPVAGQSAVRWDSVTGLRRGGPLAVDTTVKVQANCAAAAGSGNIGLFPASGGAAEPTTFLVRGR